MKSKIVLGIVMMSLAMVSGCASKSGIGFFGMTPPITIDYVVSGDNFVNSDVSPSKIGTSEARGFLFLFASGDCSIGTAMRNGKITKVHHVDYDMMNFFGLFSYVKTIVYGE